MSTSAYNAIIKASGISTVFTDAKLVKRTATTYQIFDATKRLFDSETPVIVNLTSSGEKTSRAYTVDYMTGTITFAAAPPAASVFTASGKYIPTMVIAGATTFSVDITRELFDRTSFDQTSVNGGQRTRKYGLIDVAVGISRYDDLAGIFKQKMQDGQSVYIEIKPSANSGTIRGWFLVESANSGGGVGDLETEELSFTLSSETNRKFTWT